MQGLDLMGTAALIVAAGRPADPKAFDPSQKLGGISLLMRAVTTFRKAGVREIVVVTGYCGKKLGRQLARTGVICLPNDSWRNSDMLESVKIGASYLKGRFDRIFITPVDTPMFSVKTLRLLLASQAPASAPVVQNTMGHPLLIQDSSLHLILGYEGEGGLREAVRSLVGYTAVAVEDPGTLMDLQTHPLAADSGRLPPRQPLTPQFSLSLVGEFPFFDQEACLLLNLIARTRSVRAACQQMNLSYSKGWEILNNMERQLGFAVLERHPGGPSGGWSQLSDQGRRLVSSYTCLCHVAGDFLETEFETLFQWLCQEPG